MIQSNSVEYAHEPETEVHIFSVKLFSHEISFMGSTDEGIDDEEQHVKYFLSVAAVKIGKKKSAVNHLFTFVYKWLTALFFANFYCSDR